MRTIRCNDCDTYNRLYRITCMVCGEAMPPVVTGRVLAARASVRAARIAVYFGYGIAALILVGSFIRHGAQPNQDAGLSAAAAMGFGHAAAYFAHGLADRLQPDGEPDWREAAEILKQLASDLAAHDASDAVDQLDRHGGIESLALILAAVGKRAETERAEASRCGDDEEARYQVEVREASYAAVNSLFADQARRTHWQ